jgi:NitT/TauT family transport system ATP-binding protein
VLLDWRTVLGNVMLQADVRRLDRDVYQPRAVETLRQVGLGDFLDHHPYQLSGGMRQRVSIARALLHGPSLVLMDEPFGALDALTREQMAEDLQQLWMQMRMTVLFVTHSIPEAVFLSDRVLVFSPRPGKLVANVNVRLSRPRELRRVEVAAEYGASVAGIRRSLDHAAAS